VTLRVGFDARTTERPSGVGLYTLELLEALARRPDLSLVAVANPGQRLPEGVERLETPVRFDRHGPAEFFEHVQLPSLLARRGVRIFHGPNTIIPAGRASFARVVTVHDVAFRRFSGTLTASFRLLMEARTAASLVLADRTIAVSSFTAEELRALYPRWSRRVVAVPSGTPQAVRSHVRDAAREKALLSSLGLDSGKFLCAVGTLEPRKNLRLLLEAFERARLSGVKLALVGDRGWREGPLREALARMPAASVVLTGWLEGESVRDLLCASAGLVYPSLYEGFGLPPLEALALGVPVACSDLPPVRESCEGRVRFVDAQDVEGWVRALSELVDAPTLAPWCGRTFDDVAAQAVEVYRDALVASGRRGA
jgi:glycosyltransferase involved in cell wall biosynthesis